MAAAHIRLQNYQKKNDGASNPCDDADPCNSAEPLVLGNKNDDISKPVKGAWASNPCPVSKAEEQPPLSHSRIVYKQRGTHSKYLLTRKRNRRKAVGSRGHRTFSQSVEQEVGLGVTVSGIYQT